MLYNKLNKITEGKQVKQNNQVKASPIKKMYIRKQTHK